MSRRYDNSINKISWIVTVLNCNIWPCVFQHCMGALKRVSPVIQPWPSSFSHTSISLPTLTLLPLRAGTLFATQKIVLMVCQGKSIAAKQSCTTLTVTVSQLFWIIRIRKHLHSAVCIFYSTLFKVSKITSTENHQLDVFFKQAKNTKTSVTTNGVELKLLEIATKPKNLQNLQQSSNIRRAQTQLERVLDFIHANFNQIYRL